MTVRNLTVFATSVLLLCLELVEIRILAFSHWFHFVYFVMTLGLLGFAVSGTAVSINKKLQTLDEKTLYAFCLLGFAATSLLATRFGVTRVASSIQLMDQLREGNLLPFLKIYAVLMASLTFPFIFASTIICRALTDSGKSASFTYGYNLVGTALGAILFLVGIGSLGAYRLLYLVLLLSVGVGLLNWCKNRLVNLSLIFMGVISVVGLGDPTYLFTPKIDSSKNLADLYPSSVLDTKWTPMFRVDIAKTEYGGLITIDGDAKTWVYQITPAILKSTSPFVPDPEQVSRHAVFRLVPPAKRNRALVIGAGGGMDVLAAYQAGFKNVDAIDIDPVRIEWLKGKYSPLLSGLFNDPRVHTHVADGRSFVMNTANKYDAILLYNVDTLAGVSTGAYNLVENYLYTSEAFQAYFNALSPNGIFQITRPDWGGLTEVKKVFNTSLEILKENHLDPSRHLLVAKNSYQLDFLISRPRLEAAPVTQLMELYQKLGTQTAKWAFAPVVNAAGGLDLDSLYAAFKNSTMDAAYEAADTNIRPVTDDRPFFFENLRWDKVNSFFDLTTKHLANWSGIVLSTSLILSLFVILILVVYAYVGMGEKRPTLSYAIPATSFFTAIGLGYMLVQMAMIQRFSLVIGNPVVSMAVVIPTLLLSMGISSLVSNRILDSVTGSLTALALPIVALILYEVLVIPYFQPLATASFVVRVAGVITTQIPLGLCLGFCFPIGLRYFQQEGTLLAPLAWTTNGGASVLGSIIALFISLIAGFHITIIAATFCYAGAWCSFSLFILYRSRTREGWRNRTSIPSPA